MLAYAVRRAINVIIVLWLLTVFAFLLLHLAPGSPVYLILGPNVAPDEIAALTHQLGLDKPLYLQYWQFLQGIVHADMGTSIVYQTSASQLVLQRLPATLELASTAIVLSLLFAVPAGVLTAIKRQSWLDNWGSLVTVSGVSAPAFWLGVMLVLVFSVKFGWFATSGRGPALTDAVYFAVLGDPSLLVQSVRHLLLPAITLGAFQAAFISRLTRSSVLEELGQGYVRAARARGLPWSIVIWKHVLRNALLPVVTVLGLEISGLVGGSVIAEAVFGWPGVGQLIYTAVSGRDYPLAQAGILIIGALVVTITFAVDLSYAILDPRIRLG